MSQHNTEANKSAKCVLLLGATGGIGQAILDQLKNDKQVTEIYATYRDKPDTDSSPDRRQNSDKVMWVSMDATDEASVEQAMAVVTSQTNHIDWVINAIGILHTPIQGPEKAIRQFDPAFFIQNMQVNTLPSLILAKHIKPLLKAAKRSEQTPAIFATVSARVGSISDNRVGGWYSYRMSKTALNMGMKTLSIEWGRSLKNTCVVVLQPGTVDTKLSEPFQGNVAPDQLFSPAFSAKKLINVLSKLKAYDTGSFLDWSGQRIEW